MILAYALLSLIIFWMVGYFIMRVFKIGEDRLSRNPLFPVLFGFCGLLLILMTLGLLIPIHFVSAFVVIAVFVVLLLHAREIYHKLVLNTSKGDKIYVAAVSIPMLLAGLPQLLRNELYIAVLQNNDFGYYISSMDWLKNHTLLAEVGYSASHPFYSMADYMLTLTRIGTDVTGAFLMDVFHLEAYQVFPLTAVIGIALIMIAVYEVIYCFCGNQFISAAIAIMAAINGNNVSLIGRQYMPQLIGMALMLLSLFEIDHLFRNHDREAVIVSGLILSGLLATYCEFVVYIVPFCLVYAAFFLLKKELHILALVKAAAIMILFNLFGFVRAIRFLLTIFSTVSGSGITGIDPMSSMLEPMRLTGMLVGLSDNIEWTMHPIYYVAGTALLAGIIICLVLVIVMNRTGMQWMLFLVWAAVFLMYEVYFKLSGGGYPEFKHASSGCLFVFCMIGILVSQIPRVRRIGLYGQITIITLLGIFVYGGLFLPVKESIRTHFYINHDIMELREAADLLVPSNEEIELDDSIQTINYMGAAYALKDRILNLNTGASSYLQFFNQFKDDDPSAYVVYPRTLELSLAEEELVWMNEKYILAKRDETPSWKWIDFTNEYYFTPEGVLVSVDGKYIQSGGGKQKYILHGPYAPANGRYEFVLEYTVLDESQKTGNFNILVDGDQMESVEMDSEPGEHRIHLSDIQFHNSQNVEFRVWAKKGYAVRIDGLKYRRLDVE